MKKYFIKLYQDYIDEKTEIVAVPYSEGQIIEVDEKQMFRWIEAAKNDKIKLGIFLGQMVCDLS